jgi:hypothetical protein
MNAIEQSKKLAAYNAVDHHVKPEHRVSTALLTDLCIYLVLIFISGHWNRIWYA